MGVLLQTRLVDACRGHGSTYTYVVGQAQWANVFFVRKTVEARRMGTSCEWPQSAHLAGRECEKVCPPPSNFATLKKNGRRDVRCSGAIGQWMVDPGVDVCDGCFELQSPPLTRPAAAISCLSFAPLFFASSLLSSLHSTPLPHHTNKALFFSPLVLSHRLFLFVFTLLPALHSIGRTLHPPLAQSPSSHPQP